MMEGDVHYDIHDGPHLNDNYNLCSLGLRVSDEYHCQQLDLTAFLMD